MAEDSEYKIGSRVVFKRPGRPGVWYIVGAYLGELVLKHEDSKKLLGISPAEFEAWVPEIHKPQVKPNANPYYPWV